MRAYRVLRALLKRAVSVFFRHVEVVGLHHLEATRDGAVIFCGNHPNSLIDPILITAFCGRVVHFAAKDTLFQSRFLRFFLRILGAVPVRRKSDHPDGPLDNQTTFQALHQVLAQGRAVGIFPEGLSHNESQLQPLKTGAARIAFGTKTFAPAARVYLLPTGLCYFTPNRFRSSVLIQFGEPILVDDAWMAAHERDPRAAARDLTSRVELTLRGLTVNAEDWDTLRVLDGVRRLYQPARISLEERVELSRRFNTVFPTVKDQPSVRALYARVSAYLVRVSAVGLTDSVLRRDMSVWETLGRVVRHLFLLLFWLPLAILGAPLHVPLGALFKIVGNYFAPRKDVVATTKFLLGFLTLLVVYAGLAGYAALTWGLWWGVAVGVVLPFSGGALVRVLGRVDALKNLVLTLLRVLWLQKEVRELRQERAKLEQAVVIAVEQFLPADMEPMFPRASEGTR